MAVKGTLTSEELALFKRVAKTSGPAEAQLPTAHLALPKIPREETKPAQPKKPKVAELPVSTFDSVSSIEPSRTAYLIDSPARLWTMLMPELPLYKWQFEELERIAGRVRGVGQLEITAKTPYKLALAAANSSGKDMVVIAAAAVWFAMSGVKNRVIITSSSHEQVKVQTEPHIITLITRANKMFGKIFHSIQFHHIIPELGSEIKIFATDDPQKAEGYHPFPGGKMMIIINEAKGVPEDIFKAVSRCHGFSYWIEISSPGRRSGTFFKDYCSGIEYPRPIELGKFYTRKVTAFDCPHFAPSEIANYGERIGINSPLYKSSILAEFSDYDEAVVVPAHLYELLYTLSTENKIAANGNDIGIGLDLAAGGDECGFWARRGNVVLDKYFFHQANTNVATDLIHNKLLSYFEGDYTFNADDGGIGKSMIDNLVDLGWKINRRNNQSQAFNRREFLNLGAEMYFKVRRLIEKRQIVLPYDEKLKEQLTTRRYLGDESTQGKYALENKKVARASGRPSPDRADAFVLCFYNYNFDKTPEPTIKRLSPEEYRDYLEAQAFMKQIDTPRNPFHTILNGNIR